MTIYIIWGGELVLLIMNHKEEKNVWQAFSEVMKGGGLHLDSFYACDGFTFNISRIVPPGSEEIKIVTASQWTALSRHLVEDLLDPSKHSVAWKKYNFYMAISVIPDESYVPTFAINSGHVVVNRPLHLLKAFNGLDAYQLCRYYLI